jgi:hypothetical protein
MADGLIRTQAAAELRRPMADATIVGRAARRTVEEAGTAYIDHLEHVMERNRTTIADDRGYLRKHLAPFSGSRLLDKSDRARVTRGAPQEARRVLLPLGDRVARTLDASVPRW